MKTVQDIQDPELKKLRQAFEGFTAAMWKKLVEKHDEGFSGWDWLSKKELNRLFLEHAIKQIFDGDEEVDCANFLLFRWYRGLKRR